jgi:hypothetical protein
MATVPDSQQRRRPPAAVDVGAAECDSMCRRLEHPEIERVDWLRRFLAGMPSALRA